MGWKPTSGSDADAIHDNVAAEISAIAEKGAPVNADLVVIEDSAAANAKKRVQVGNLPGASPLTTKGDLFGYDTGNARVPVGTNTHVMTADSAQGLGVKWAAPGSASADHDYFTYAAAMLEPLAIEELQFGTIAYVVGAAETKIILSSWETDLGATGRFDMRDARFPMPLRDITLSHFAGSDDSTAAIIDPSLPTYTTARDDYYDRLETIFETATKYVGATGGSGQGLLLPGPYGIIIVGISFHDTPWLAMVTPHGFSKSFLPIHNEIGDAAGDDLRISQRMLMPASKNIMVGFQLGVAGGPNAVEAGVAYIICPSTWGKVTDPNSYDFRDDFMGATLDTGSDWTRSQSTAGNVEIETNFAWCKAKGNGTWGNNGAFSQSSIAVAASKVFLCDIYIDLAAEAGKDANIVVGFHDGGGQSFSDFAHGIDITNSGGAKRMVIFENGTSRGAVGPNPGWTGGCSYRARITIDGAGAATYEMQGGPEYPEIGGSSWTDITPGTTSSATDPLHAGFTVEQSHTHYVGDVKLY